MKFGRKRSRPAEKPDASEAAGRRSRGRDRGRMTGDRSGDESRNAGPGETHEDPEAGASEGSPAPVVVTDVLDLHGLYPEQASLMTEAFIENAAHLGLSHVRIIHGKGKSRLKWEVIQILKNHPKVQHFHDAPLESGGWGATAVELKR